MKLLDEMIHYNCEFVSGLEFEKYQTSKLPKKKAVIISCMDTRLIELLPKALNIKNGDVKLIKVAGAEVTHPFDIVMKSIILAVYELEAEEIFVIGHYECGACGIDSEVIIEKSKTRVNHTLLDQMNQYPEVDLGTWLKGFPSVEEIVKKSISIIRTHPLIPSDVSVHGLLINPDTGKLDIIESGYLTY